MRANDKTANVDKILKDDAEELPPLPRIVA